MKRLLMSFVLLGSLAAAMSSFASDKETPKQSATTQPTKAINAFCPVDRDDPVDPTVPTVVYQGKVIGFCCEDCIPKFNSDPVRYMKNLK